VKAIVDRRYGFPDVLRFEDVDKPIPRNDEAKVNDDDLTAIRGLIEERRVSP